MVSVVAVAVAALPAGAGEIFLGGKDFLLAGERSGERREVRLYLPYGADRTDWTERVEVHHYPELEQPRRVVLEVLDRLRGRHPDLTYRILPDPTENRAGLSYLVEARGGSEVRLEYILYEETGEAPGLMAYRFTFRSTGPDARYSRSLLRGKWDYYERAFLETDWPPSLDSPPRSTRPNLFAMEDESFGERMDEAEPVETRSLTVRNPGGRVLRVDERFLANQGIESRPPPFSFTAPRDTENLFVEYQSAGIPEILKLSLAGPDRQLVENLRVFPFRLPGGEGNERLWKTAGKLLRKVENEYLLGWDDIRAEEPFLTRVGPYEAFVCLATFADPEGNRMFARFTLLLPPVGDRGLLAFSQVDPRYASVKRLEDLESGGVMTAVAHSIRFLDAEPPEADAGEGSDAGSPLPYDSLDGEPGPAQ